MTDIIVAIIGVAGVILGIMISALVAQFDWYARLFQRRHGLPLNPDQLFDVAFVNQQGQNVYVKNPDTSSQPDSPSWFRVTAHFKLHVKESVNLKNIELNYPAIVNSFPGNQIIKINDEQQSTDGTYGLVRAIKVDRDTVLDIFLFRTFFCHAKHTWQGDYKELAIILDFATPRSDGFHRLAITGTLQPGGEVANVATQLDGP